MRWLVGFLLGIVGGWALGAVVAPRGGRGAGGLSRWLGTANAEARPAAGGLGGARRYGGLLEDDRLTRVARARLLERDVDDLRIDVTTVDSVMYLRGRPRTAHDAASIVDVAETTPGVTQVVNELKPLDQEEPEAAAAKRG